MGLGLIALLVGACVWLPALHLIYARPAGRFHAATGVPREAEPLLKRQLALLSSKELRAQAVSPMRQANPEWDFMGRSFVAWSLANWALRVDPAGDKPPPDALTALDRLLDDTLTVEREQGMYAFLMGYARSDTYRVQPARSLFVESELAMTMGLRRMVRDDKPALRAQHAERVARLTALLGQNDLHAAESYPNECWTFDHAVALAALRVADKLDGTDHHALIKAWLDAAHAHLTDARTGLLVSSYTVDGHVLDGPEGSTLWMTIHCLALVDEPFARDQYQRARRELGAGLLGFGWAREWPRSWQGPRDIDSGPVIPLLDVSAGSSGLAFVAASTFDDTDYQARLHATLDFAAFPVDGGYAASNQVGDAVLLYSMLLGPAWERAR
jgi:hypothetical protein